MSHFSGVEPDGSLGAGEPWAVDAMLDCRSVMAAFAMAKAPGFPLACLPLLGVENLGRRGDDISL